TGAGDQQALVGQPGGGAGGQLVGHVGGVEVEAQSGGGQGVGVLDSHLIQVGVADGAGLGGHSHVGALGVGGGGPILVQLLDLLHAVLFHVLEVHTLDAVGEPVADLGVGVDQLQQSQGLVDVGGGGVDAGDGTLDGVVGDHGVTELADHDLSAAALAPAHAGAGPALGHAHRAHALEVVQSVGVGVDQAVVVPSVHLAELIQNVVLLKDGDHLGVVAVVA